MKLHEIRVGNYVKESKFSSRGRALEGEYAVELHDMSYHFFMQPIPITKEWCKKLGFEMKERYHETSNYDWIAEKGFIKVHCLDNEITVLFNPGVGTIISLENIKNVHELQNFYYFWHLEELL